MQTFIYLKCLLVGMINIYKRVLKIGNSHYISIPKEYVDDFQLAGKYVFAQINAQDDGNMPVKRGKQRK
jgi:hypothetical protein